MNRRALLLGAFSGGSICAAKEPGAIGGQSIELKLRPRGWDVLQLEFRRIETKDRVINHSGYVEYDGMVVRSLTSPPQMILTRGLVIGGKNKIELDIRGLGNCWNLDEGEGMSDGYINLEDLGHSIWKLQVCFVKGGGDDFLVEWILLGGSSLRTGVLDLGDSLPKWVR